MITLKFSNLPVLNQRFEYDRYKRLLADPEFRRQLDTKDRDELHCGKFVWANKEEGSSVLLQRIILGLEARIPAMVSLELGCRCRLTADMVEKLSDPFTLGPGGTAACYYNHAPALIEPRFALQVADPELWELVRTFYRGIRNKLFHGYMATDVTAAKLDYIFSVFDRVYTWNDSWCDILSRMNEVSRGMHDPPRPAEEKR